MSRSQDNAAVGTFVLVHILCMYITKGKVKCTLVQALKVKCTLVQALKVKCTLVQALKVKYTLVRALMLCTGRTAHRGSRGTALPVHDHGTRRG